MADIRIGCYQFLWCMNEEFSVLLNWHIILLHIILYTLYSIHITLYTSYIYIHPTFIYILHLYTLYTYTYWQVSYLISAWARMCKILGPEFEQYLPMVMPPVLKAASIKPEVRMSCTHNYTLRSICWHLPKISHIK